jgi:hypothetical protein
MPDRKDFGEGRAGDIAWSIIRNSAKCKHCNNTATHTIDVDVKGDPEFFPCCDNCDAAIIAILKHDLGLIQIDTVNTFSSNGTGRNMIDRDKFAKPGL